MNEEWIFVGGFATKVFEYLRLEWCMDPSGFTDENRDWALGLISELKGKESVQNIAAKVAEGLPI